MGKAVGTPCYMPPEQFRTDDLDPESDWYSVGCVLHEILTGKCYFAPRRGSRCLTSNGALPPQRIGRNWKRLKSRLK
jgi:serine/threonine protein kinase